ncbi:hypothetical protein Ancab_001444 [Ancistrocladus abbreviatus]
MFFNEFEEDLAAEGRSHGVHCAREQLKVLCRSNLQEAKWCDEKCIPTCKEHMPIAIPNFGYILEAVACYLGLGELLMV